LQPGESGEVVGEIGECDLGGRPRQADGADHQSEAALLGGEDVLDLGVNPCPLPRPERRDKRCESALQIDMPVSLHGRPLQKATSMSHAKPDLGIPKMHPS
jgi:hypothetical protein